MVCCLVVHDPANDIPGCPSGFPAGEAGQRLEHAIAFARKAHIIIDAMTGIGGTGALHGIPAALASVLGPDPVMSPTTPRLYLASSTSGMRSAFCA